MIKGTGTVGAAAQKKGGKENVVIGAPSSGAPALPAWLPAWAEKKLRRILKNNGEAEAKRWAEQHGPTPEKILARLLRERRQSQSQSARQAPGPAVPPMAQQSTPSAPSATQTTAPPTEVKLVVTTSLPQYQAGGGSFGEILLGALAQVRGVSPQELARVVAEEAARAPAPAPQPAVLAKARKAAAPKAPAAKASKPRPKRPVSAKKALANLANFFKKSAPAPKKDRRQ
jgi:hypothetical protein